MRKSDPVLVFFLFDWMLLIVLATLKLAGLVTWSWWWVTFPLWAPTAFVLIFGCMFLSMTFLIGIVVFLVGRF